MRQKYAKLKTVSRGSAGFLDLAGSNFGGNLGDGSPSAGFRGRAPGGGKLNKHCKLYTFESILCVTRVIKTSI